MADPGLWFGTDSRLLFSSKRRFSLLSVQTWSKVHMKVIIPGKLPLSLRSKNVLILSSYESFS